MALFLSEIILARINIPILFQIFSQGLSDTSLRNYISNSSRREELNQSLCIINSQYSLQEKQEIKMARKLVVLGLIFMAVVGLASAAAPSASPAATPSASSPAFDDAELSSPPAPAAMDAEAPVAETPLAEDEPLAPSADDLDSGAAALSVSAAAASVAIAGFFL